MASKGTFPGGYVVMDPAALATLLRSPQGPVIKDVFRRADAVVAEAKRICPVYVPPDEWTRSHRTRRPGTLRDSIVKRIAEQDGQPIVLVGSNDPVALFVHEGTVAHQITARKAPALVFRGRDGNLVRIPKPRSVNHRGTRPNRFLVLALRVFR